MVNVDIKSLFFLFSAGFLFIIFFLSVYLYSQKVRPPVIKVFIFTKVLLLAQMFIYMSSKGSPTPNAAITAFTFFIFGISYEVYCISFADRPFHKKGFIRFSAIPLFVSFVFILISAINPEYVRVFLTNLIGSLIYLFGGIYLILRKTKTKMQRISSFFFLFVSLLFLSRLLWTVFGDSSNRLYTQNVVNLISYTGIFLVSFSWAIVLILILKEKDEERIEENNFELKKLNRNKDKFFSIISHDLRGPLGNLFKLGELLWIQQDTLTAVQRSKLLKGIYESSKQTFLLVDNLLKWANSNSGHIKYEPENINLKEIIDENLNIFKLRANAKKIGLRSLIKHDLLVYADHNMINTVVRNLISNAMKFTHKSGEIKILTKKKKDGEACTVGVIDNGIGMSEKVISKVLDMDSNVSTAGTENELGSGLGLKLCKEFIVKNNGNIWIESEEQHGTKIWFSLPVCVG